MAPDSDSNNNIHHLIVRCAVMVKSSACVQEGGPVIRPADSGGNGAPDRLQPEEGSLVSLALERTHYALCYAALGHLERFH